MEAEGSTSTQSKSSPSSEASENNELLTIILSRDSVDEKYTEIPYEIVPGKRKNSQLLWSPSERQFYKRNCIGKIGAAYLCICKSCKIRVYLKDGKCFKINTIKTHNHGPKDELEYRYRVMNEIKSKIILLADSKMSNRDIYNEVICRNQSCKLKFEEIERTLQNIRSSTITASPENASENATVFMREENMNGYDKTKTENQILDKNYIDKFPSVSSPVKARKHSSNSKHKTKSIVNIVNDLKNLQASINATLDEVDSFDAFGTSVAKQLKKLSEEKALLAQSEIQNILTKYGIENLRERN